MQRCNYHLHKPPGWKSSVQTHGYITLTWWENEPLQSISKSAEQTEESRKLHRLKSRPIINNS